ncbi:MAG: hypothetical protein M1813_002102 [Trichoglossum hirsutum]|jgi:hypothetical protein|nr:MAG: hypothetical protein M1813_002102 [Trichoglossum hirsutum]
MASDIPASSNSADQHTSDQAAQDTELKCQTADEEIPNLYKNLLAIGEGISAHEGRVRDLGSEVRTKKALLKKFHFQQETPSDQTPEQQREMSLELEGRCEAIMKDCYVQKDQFRELGRELVLQRQTVMSRYMRGKEAAMELQEKFQELDRKRFPIDIDYNEVVYQAGMLKAELEFHRSMRKVHVKC